jgi:hypothetical protein
LERRTGSFGAGEAIEIDETAARQRTLRRRMTELAAKRQR